MTQISGPVHVYEDDFPKHLGPPPVPNGTGIKLHDSTKPTYTVELDQGAFMALWEHMEAEARHRYPTHSHMAYARAYLRSVKALRQAFWSQNGNQPPPPPTETPRLVRKPSKKAR